MKVIKIVDVIGSKNCISEERGELLYLSIVDALCETKGDVCVSFENVGWLLNSFLTNSIGRLYNVNETSKENCNRVKFIDTTPLQQQKINYAISYAKNIFTNNGVKR